MAAQLGSISHFQDSDQAPSWESMRAAILGARTDEPDVADLSAHRRRYTVSRRVLAVAAAIVLVAGGGIAIWRVDERRVRSSCSTSAGCQQIQLDAASGQTLASAVVRGDTITVTPTNMPNAPSGKTYVLWQQPRGGTATAIGEFTAGTGSPATVSLHAPLADTQAFAVSLESAAGPPPATPTDMLASGTIA